MVVRGIRIINLIENTEGSMGCAYAHGLSFYVETKKHKLLMDLGPSEETRKNAEKLGIDLTQVDTVQYKLTIRGGTRYV